LDAKGEQMKHDYVMTKAYQFLIGWEDSYFYILGVVKRNSLFFHSISCKNNGFLFSTPNI